MRESTIALLAALLVSLGLTACDVDQTDDLEPQTAAASNEAAAAPPAATAPVANEIDIEVAPTCADCGTIMAIEEIKADGEASGLGAVIGGVAGAAAGRQIGDGSGKDIATVAGAVGGAVAGHQIEQKMKGETYYEVTVAMDDGTERIVELVEADGIQIGDDVRVEGNNLVLI